MAYSKQTWANGRAGNTPITAATLGHLEDGLEAAAAVADAAQPGDADLTTIAALSSGTAGALVTDGAGWIRKTYAQLKTALALVKGDVGLGNVDNTSDANKPISTATQTALDLKLASSVAAGTYAPKVATWQASAAYKAGQLVVNAGTLYTANDDFTSGASFNAANWTAVSGTANFLLQDTRPSSPTTGTVRIGLAATSTTLASDSFNRADSTTSLGSATIGGAWTQLVGTWGISSNRAYTSAATANSVAVLDVGQADQVVTATYGQMSATGQQGGIVARCTDASNFYWGDFDPSTGWRIVKRVAGTSTVIASGASPNGVTGDIIKLSVIGSELKLYRNGTLLGTVTDTSLATGNKAGMRSNSSTVVRLDDFLVTSA